MMQKRERARLNNAPDIFTAYTNEIGSDGGLDLEFKSNGILKITKMDHWELSEYRGRYQMKDDTVDLDIPLEFKLGKKGVLGIDSLRFIDDTLRFEVHRFSN